MQYVGIQYAIDRPNFCQHDELTTLHISTKSIKNRTMSKSHAVIVSFARTPISKFQGGLSHLTAPQLGAAAIKGAIARLSPDHIDKPKIVEAYMGNVLSAGIG